MKKTTAADIIISQHFEKKVQNIAFQEMLLLHEENISCSSFMGRVWGPYSLSVPQAAVQEEIKNKLQIPICRHRLQ